MQTAKMDDKMLNAKPLVSIITPMFNTEAYFEETYKSVIQQTECRWEWIIVDDCSTDGSLALARCLANGDARIRIIASSRNGGTSAARNIGLENAAGRYILFLDSDDTLDKDFLKEQIAFIAKNGPIVTSSYRRKAKSTITDFIVPEVITYESLLLGNAMSCLTTMYDREAVGDPRFDETIAKCEDYVFWLGILRKGFCAKGNKCVLATYMIREGSKSSAKIRLIKPMFHVYHKTQGFGVLKSAYFVFRWAFYGLKKYRGVR